MLLLGWSEGIFGQAAHGRFVRMGFDQSEALIPACAVVAENVGTSVLRSQRTDELGTYRSSNLPVGRYTLTAQAESFAPARLSGTEADLDHPTAANIELAVGDVWTAVVAAAAQIPVER